MEWNGTQHHKRTHQRVTLCVEGNISAGKTTFLQELLKGSIELRGEVEVLILLPFRGPSKASVQRLQRPPCLAYAAPVSCKDCQPWRARE